MIFTPVQQVHCRHRLIVCRFQLLLAAQSQHNLFFPPFEVSPTEWLEQARLMCFLTRDTGGKWSLCGWRQLGQRGNVDSEVEVKTGSVCLQHRSQQQQLNHNMSFCFAIYLITYRSHLKTGNKATSFTFQKVKSVVHFHYITFSNLADALFQSDLQ